MLLQDDPEQNFSQRMLETENASLCSKTRQLCLSHATDEHTGTLRCKHCSVCLFEATLVVCVSVRGGGGYEMLLLESRVSFFILGCLYCLYCHFW